MLRELALVLSVSALCNAAHADRWVELGYRCNTSKDELGNL